jgi:hypothetical protein
MKKAKIMLTAITVLAIVGGALAFKASSFTAFDLCTVNVGSGTLCTTISLQSTADIKAVNPDFYYTVIDHNVNNDITSCNDKGGCIEPGTAPQVD